MNFWTWSAIGTGVYLLAKKPESAVLVPAPVTSTPPVVVQTPPVVVQPPVVVKPPATQPAVVTKLVVTNGRQYKVTRAGLGIYKVELANDPSVFQLITQNGPLQERGDPTKLAQLKADEAQFPGNLFT